MTRSAPGITRPAISRDGGASRTQGELSSKSKKTDPFSLTARRTSERTSTFMGAARASRADRKPVGRAAMQRGRAGSFRSLADERQDFSDAGNDSQSGKDRTLIQPDGSDGERRES